MLKKSTLKCDAINTTICLTNTLGLWKSIYLIYSQLKLLATSQAITVFANSHCNSYSSDTFLQCWYWWTVKEKWCLFAILHNVSQTKTKQLMESENWTCKHISQAVSSLSDTSSLLHIFMFIISAALGYQLCNEFSQSLPETRCNASLAAAWTSSPASLLSMGVSPAVSKRGKKQIYFYVVVALQIID